MESILTISKQRTIIEFYQFEDGRINIETESRDEQYMHDITLTKDEAKQIRDWLNERLAQ